METQGGAPFASVQQVLKWEPFSQNFYAWSHEYSFGDNFAAAPGDYLFLVLDESAPVLASFVGRMPQPGEVSFALAAGVPGQCALNFLSLPLDQAALTTANALSDDIGTPDVTVLQALDWESSLQNFLAWSNEFGFGDDFPTSVGYSYILCLSDMGVPLSWP
jgi:hypothetical protein